MKIVTPASGSAIRRAVFFGVRLLLIGLLAGSLPASNVYGEGWRPPSDMAGWGRVSLGFVSGIIGHELGHVAVATAQGNKVGFDGLSLVYPDAKLGGAEQFHAASAGFQAQWLISETVLWHHEHQPPGHRMGDFGAGLVVSHLAITGAYLTVLYRHDLGDIRGMSRGSGAPVGQLLAAITIPAVLDGWRLFADHPPRWVPTGARIVKGVGIAAVWAY